MPQNAEIKKIGRITEIFDTLAKTYPAAETELTFASDFELLIAVILSAQCTDKRVNEVTRELFKEINTPLGFALTPLPELEKKIHSCGFYRAKAANIVKASRAIVDRFGGKVPQDFDSLISLAGVGRKTANVMLSVAFGQEAFAVDTHVFRLSRRLGLSDGDTPEAVERDVTRLLDGKGLSRAHHLLIFHGRYCCKAQKPACADCTISELCPFFASAAV